MVGCFIQTHRCAAAFSPPARLSKQGKSNIDNLFNSDINSVQAARAAVRHSQ